MNEISILCSKCRADKSGQIRTRLPLSSRTGPDGHGQKPYLGLVLSGLRCPVLAWGASANSRS
jgi:hypothetical protein